VLLTSRLSEGRHNVVAGTDLFVRAGGDDYLVVQLAQSWDTADSLAIAPDRWLGRARWERRGNYGLLYAMEAARVGARFSPELGFLSRQDFAKGGARLAYGWRAPTGSPVLRQQVALVGNGYRRNSRDLIETADLTAEWTLESRQGRILALGATGRYDDLAQPFALGGGVSVPA
jgi:hypothetical protein